MSDPTLGPLDVQAILEFEAEADRIFGEDSQSLRNIMGVVLYELRERAGPEATRTYVLKALDHIRRIDLLAAPPPEKPKAS